ncbi:MAG TPA: DUF1552 domain-containing protein [Planctomycetota bacterium]|nr:DUF1552 domain-containing protein [Planctomycetota bacterium]
MTLDRRSFLRAAGVSLALPWLEAPAFARTQARGPIRRMVVICTPLGLHGPNFFPETAGDEYALTPYLEVLSEFRKQFTVVSGLAHPEVGSSHDSMYSFLTAAPHPEVRAGFRNSISLDQFAAERIGGETRTPSLSLADEGVGLSWTRSGAPVPADSSPSRVFARFFLEGRPEDVAAQARRLRDGQSILDSVRGQAGRLTASLGAGDREKLDEYFTSVRELEQRIARSEEWAKKPKPKVNATQPQDISTPTDLIGRTRLLFDLTHLALQSDSTRLVTIMLLGTSGVPPIPGVSLGHHDLSHHGQDPVKLEQLKKVELEKMKRVRDLLAKLKESQEEDATLLDRTMVFFSSNLGNASNHSARNLPVLLAGGGFRHGKHLAFDPASPPPLSNLYLSMLHRLGIEAEKFGSSTGTLPGLVLED